MGYSVPTIKPHSQGSIMWSLLFYYIKIEGNSFKRLMYLLMLHIKFQKAKIQLFRAGNLLQRLLNSSVKKKKVIALLNSLA